MRWLPQPPELTGRNATRNFALRLRGLHNNTKTELSADLKASWTLKKIPRLCFLSGKLNQKKQLTKSPAYIPKEGNQKQFEQYYLYFVWDIDNLDNHYMGTGGITTFATATNTKHLRKKKSIHHSSRRWKWWWVLSYVLLRQVFSVLPFGSRCAAALNSPEEWWNWWSRSRTITKVLTSSMKRLLQGKFLYER